MMTRGDNMDISILLGKTLQKITRNTDEYDDEEIIFEVSDTEKYRMYHEVSCCEKVTIEEIHGNLDWLVGEPILRAEARSNSTRDDDSCPESQTWTFYELGTIKGSVTIRWYGSSNGYYSEDVDFEKIQL